MKQLTYLSLLLLCCWGTLSAQPANGKNDYLVKNRIDLRSNNALIKQNVVGFTVIHGSQKAEDAELALLKAQLAGTDTLHYFPEIDAAMAYYFNVYLNNGDEGLLKDLILTYKNRVPQEASIAMFNKWKTLQSMATNKQLVVHGIDVVVSYKYYAKLLMELSGNSQDLRDSLSTYLQNPQTDYSVGKNTPLQKYLQTAVLAYQSNKTITNKSMQGPSLFDYLIDNLNDSFKDKKQARRDSLITKNYLTLHKLHKLSSSKQFIRMGVYHLMKERFENTQPGFIAALIESKVYKDSDIYVVQAFLHNSKVLWQRTYSETGAYTGYTEEGGFYSGETLPWVPLFADNSPSDLTFFDLSKKGSPLEQLIGLDLGVWKLPADKALSDYLDGAILVKDSPANVPIEALE